MSPKIQYARAAERSEAASSGLRIPVWCRILEIARTGAAAPTGGAMPPQETGAAKPHRSKTAKEPGKPSALTIQRCAKSARFF